MIIEKNENDYSKYISLLFSSFESAITLIQ